MADEALREVFADHSRHWRDFHHVYPVVSRRSRGVSIGVNLTPDQICNFRCVYCSVDRRAAPALHAVDLGRLEHELHALLGGWQRLFDEPRFAATPPALRRLNDVAFSGDGEPTASPLFPQAARVAARVKAALRLDAISIVTITNACFLDRPEVEEALAFLDAHGGEVWAKLDAGTEERFRRMNRPNLPLARVLDNIAACGRRRPVVIQSLFARADTPPDDGEIEAYVGRLAELRQRGAALARVQVYTVSRRTAEDGVAPLAREELERIAARVRAIGVSVECFGAAGEE